MDKLCILIFLLQIFISTYSQELATVSPSTMALSGGVTAYKGVNEPFGNPASNVAQAQAGFSFNNKYMLPELGTLASYGSVNTFGGLSSLALCYFGTALYNQSALSYTYGRKLYPWLNAGVRMNYYTYRVQVLQQDASALTGEIGFQAFVNNALAFGIHWVNPSQSAYNSEQSQPLNSTVKMGVALQEKKLYYFSVELNYSEYTDFSYNIGAEYWLMKSIALRAGSTLAKDSRYSIGFLTQYQSLQISLAFQRHMVLGMSSGVSVNYTFGNYE